MNTSQPSPKNIDEYIATFPENVQELLETIRKTIREAAPDAEETISYQMPTFTLKGHHLIYFAAYKKHIGLYPVPKGDAEFDAEILPYVAGKGTLQFPLYQPIPYALIVRIVKARAKETLERPAARTKKNA